MPVFSYQARDDGGQLVAGTVEADDARAAAAVLGRQGYRPVRIRQRGVLDAWQSAVPWGSNRINRREILILFRELAALLRAGIPLASSLQGAIQQTETLALRQVLSDIARRVQGGTSFSEALSRHPSAFPQLFISMIRVGEVAGILDQVLEQLAQIGTQELETRSRVQSALAYPIVLMGFAFLVVNGLLIGVLPRFVTVFEASQVKLPLPTALLLGLSWIVRTFWWLLLGLMIWGGWWAKQYYARPKGRMRVDRWLLHAPVFSDLYRKILIARIVRTLGAMLKTGVPLLEALSVTEKTVPNMVFQHALQRTQAAVQEGQSLTESWNASGLFPPLVLQMVSAGERAGQLDSMLSEVATFYDPEIELTTRNLTTLLEPILLLGMGLMVGFIALSVLLPIFQLIHVFRR